MKCPGCSHVFALKEILLSKCSANIKYQLFGDNESKTKTIPRIEDKRYVMFGDEITKIIPTDKNNNMNNSSIIPNNNNNQQSLYKMLEFNVKR